MLAVRRRKGNSQTDVTSFHPGQASWNKGDPPEIFYQLRPTQAWIDFAKSARPGQKLDAAGQPMVEREPPPGKIARPVLAFAVLPDKIGTKEDMVSFRNQLELTHADNSSSSSSSYGDASMDGSDGR